MLRRLGTSALALALVVLGIPLGVPPAAAASPDLVIDQVYGGGGNTGAPYQNDYVQLFNRGASAVALTGKSIQYASATGTGNFGITNQITLLTGSLAAGQRLLVAEAGGAVGAPLPAPDITGNIAMAAGSGKIALVNSTTSLGCNGSSTVCSPAQLALIIDLVGYGSANFFETAAAPTLSNTTAAIRKAGGTQDTDNNSADFQVGAPAPRVPEAAPSVTSTTPASGATNVAVSSNVVVTFSEPVTLSVGWSTIACTVSGAHTAIESGGPTTYTLDPSADFMAGETCTVTVIAANVSDTDTADPPDSMAADHVLTFTVATPTDNAPSVVSNFPASGATNVPADTTVTIGFSEAVTFTATDWYTISCASSGGHAATVSVGGPAANVYVLDPTSDLAFSELCTVTVVAAKVIDADPVDPPDAMTADVTFSFTTAGDPCLDPATFIHQVQGGGLASGMVGQTRTIQGVVVGDYQATGQFGGFYVQEEDLDADTDAATSEGIFVFSSSPVSAGDVVRVTGKVTEFSNLTELTSPVTVRNCGTGASVTPTLVTLPVPTFSAFERYEGMLVTFSQTLTATETFTLGRFGEVRLAANGRLYTPTAIVTPGPAAVAQADLNKRSSFVLDDGNNQQNIDPTIHPVGGLSASNTLRSGYTTSGLTGVFDERFSAYRLQPVGPVPFAPSNPRTAAPSASGGNTKVASFNVLNFFNGNGSGLDGAAGGFPTARGANTLAELSRQRAKEISALVALNADIVGLMEIENDAPPNSAVEDLVAGLNTALGAGTYSFIDTGVIGTDAIKVALIYKPAAVTPVGAFKVITSAVDPRFVDTKNRPSLAQTFERSSTGARLTVVVNHLKSKGSDCNDLADPDTGDGQGNCNVTRARAAAALVDWLATDPTGSGDPDFLLIGDMNSYTFEDPITTFTGAGFTNLVRQFGGLSAYSYVFDGQSGYLDHALASAALAPQVTSASDWHINADEPIVLDYNVEFKTANQVNTFYDPGPYRSSDHDPVLISLDLRDTTPPVVGFSGNAGTYAITDTLAITCSATDAHSGIDTALTFCPQAIGPATAFGPGDHTLVATAVDNAGNEATASTTFTITVTAADLCTLTTRLSSKEGVANSLCVKLSSGQHKAYTNELRAQRGKAFSEADADLLIALAASL